MNNSTPLSKKEYIDAYGTDTGSAFKAALDAGSQTYGQSVKAANDDFYRSLMTYGQNAEALSGGGLTGTGVSDYGSHAAYAARQGSVATAGAAKQLAAAVATAEKKAGDQANAGAYAGYLSGYYSGQSAREDEISTSKQNTLGQILESGLTDPTQIAAYLKLNGNFTDEEIASYSQEYAGLNANSAKTTAAQGIHNALVKEGVYDEATIRARYSTIPGITSEELDQYVANTVSVMSGVATNAATSNDNAKAAAKWKVWETLRTYDSVTPDTVKLALAATGVFADETEIEAAAQELYGQLNGSKTVDNGTFLDATAFYTDVLSKSGEATAKMLTEQKFGADVTSDVITKLAETQVADQQIIMQNEIKTFSDTIKALDTNGFAVAYGTDAEGNTVAVDMLDQLEWYKNNGYFDGNEEEYERMKGDIQNHNAEYLSSLYGMARSEHKMDKVIDLYGITLPEGADDEDAMKAALEAVKNDVFDLFDAGYITSEQATTFLAECFQDNVEAILSDKRDRNETNLRDLCDRITELSNDGMRMGIAESQLVMACVDSIYDKINVEVEYFKDAPYMYYVQFGKKTLTIPAVDLLSASGKDVDKENKTFKVFEKGSSNKEKVFDVATKFSVDQMISLKLIIDAVLENQGA